MSRWTRIEKIAPKAALVTEEFVRDLAADPEYGLTPEFGRDGQPRAVNIHPPRDRGGYPRAVVGEVIVIHPDGEHEVLARTEFADEYVFRD